MPQRTLISFRKHTTHRPRGRLEIILYPLLKKILGIGQQSINKINETKLASHEKLGKTGSKRKMLESTDQSDTLYFMSK